MIDLDKLTESDIGRRVRYQDCYIREYGVITSWNDKYVFVKFSGPDGAACKPANIDFIDSQEKEKK